MCASYDGGNWNNGDGGGRGRRGYRGHRGHRGWRGTSDRNHQEDHDAYSGEGSNSGRGEYWKRGGRNRDRSPRGRGGRGGHPPGLTGREIGLYYARKSRKNTSEREKQDRPQVQMDKEKERNISSLLASIKGDDDTSSLSVQPPQSYCDISVSSDDSDDPSNPLFVIDKKGMPTDDDGQACDSWEDHCEVSPAEQSTSYASEMASITGILGDESFNEVTDSVDGVPQGQAATNDAESTISHSFHEESDDEKDDDMETGPDLIEYKKESMSDFLMEFHAHNAANRFSNENVNTATAPEMTLNLQQNPRLDALYEEELTDKESNSSYQRMKAFRKKLPSYKMRNDILNMVKSNQVCVISGETGCGKTTQVAQFILDDCIGKGQGSQCRIVCTQPRRISAIAVAERVAQERGEQCGARSVGYQIRLEHRLPRERGSILYCTTGIMLKHMTSDAWLSNTSHVILDEIHERDLQSDFLMIVLKDLVKKRTDLKVILMSATLNAEMFSQYFYNCPTINIPGYTFPVKEYVLEDVIELIRYRPNSEAFRPKRRIHGSKKREAEEEQSRYDRWVNKIRHKYSHETVKSLQEMDSNQIDIDLIGSLVDYIVREKPDGAILIFVPGWEQISKLHTLIEQNPMCKLGRMKVIPLHSQMPTVNQKEIFDRPPTGVRKVVVATNIAETSITIEDVVYVIDCGKIKMKNFDATNNIGTLQPEWVARANARQRRGRAGRVQPGECFHLYTSYHESKFADYQLPEMLRTRLEELCLMIKLLKLGKIESFVNKAMQPPSMLALHHSIQTLIQLNALDHSEELTPLGYHLAKMPVDPHTGKMLLFAAMFSCLDPILTVAASLSFKDAFYIPLGKEKIADQRRKVLADGSKSDHIMLANAYQGWERATTDGYSSRYCWDNFLSVSTLKLLKNMRRQFAELLHEMKFLDSSSPKQPGANINSQNIEVVKAVICAGLYPNVAKMKKPKRDPLLFTKTEKSLRLHPKSVNSSEYNFESPWVVYHLKMKTTKIYLYDCSLVSTYPLLFFGGDISVRKEDGRVCVVVDDWISFWSTKNIANLIIELRKELDKLLEYKITHPSCTSWDKKEKEGALMHAILDLITTEEMSMRSDRRERDWQRSLKHSNW